MMDKLRSLTFTSLAHFSVDGNVLLFPILILYLKELSLSIFVIGLMPVLYSLISGFLSVYVGSYADRVDKDAFILLTGVLLNGLSALIFSLAFIARGEAYEFLILGAVVLGVGQSIYHPIGATILTHTFGAKESAFPMGINGSFGSLGRSAIPPMVVFLAVFGIVTSLRILFVYFLIASILIYFGLNFFRRKNYSYDIRTKPSNAAENHEAVRGIPAFLVLLVVIVFLRSMFISVTTTWIPYYLDDFFNSKTLTATVIGIAFLAPVIGQPFFGYLTSRFGGKFSISVTSVGLVVFFVAFLYLSKGFSTILGSYTLFAFFAYTGFPVLLGYVSQNIPKEHSTRANATVWGVGNTIGGATGLLLFDGLHLFINIFYSFTVILVFAVVSALLIVYLPGRPRSTDELQSTI